MKRFLPALVVFAALAGGCSEPETKKDDKDAKKDDSDNNKKQEEETGEVKIELFADKAPITVKNFLDYVDDKHYDGTVFHRVMPDFMVQGGHFTRGFAKARSYEDAERLGKKTRDEIKNEAKNGLSNKRGTLAMARTQDPDSATDQFFINLKHNDFLDKSSPNSDGAGYAVFGQVTEGMDVVDKIKKVKTKTLFRELGPRGAMGDVPVDEVVIESIRREEAK